MVARVNLPNAITFSRLVLTVAFVIVVSWKSATHYGIGLALFSIAAASDFLDGWLARKMGLVTPLGKLMDPLVDKILVCTAFVFFSAKGLCPVWITALIMGREFLVTGLRQVAVEAGEVLAADNLGKWKTTFQLTYLITGLVWLTFSNVSHPGAFSDFLVWLAAPDGWLMILSLWAAVALTVISGYHYFHNSRHLIFKR
ncbi:MAG: CDP-diacylglycerol--glycerol-3-phosphate 3-phosphatidyltransferase [Luteolibacter sp.]